MNQIVARLSATICVASIACASGPTRYDRKLNEAAAASAARDPVRELGLLDDALRLAQTENERGEALYRKAHALFDLGRTQAGLGTLRAITSEHPTSNRSARAWLDLGRQYEKVGALDRAESCYLHLIRRYPSSGGAISAARRIAAIRQGKGQMSDQTYGELRKATPVKELQEAMLYFEASALEEQDAVKAAEKFRELVAQFPLPGGVYADEALLRLALTARARSKPHEALNHLAELRRHDRPASIIGSYTRTAYLDSYILAAQILRDDLGRFGEARSILERARKNHAESVIVDEIHFELALLDSRVNADPCQHLATMISSTPHSRYARCAKRMCADLDTADAEPDSSEPDSSEQCARWMERGTPLLTRFR